ncbi:MAG: hypothetical protein HY924_02550 [Elusimicrobia bacterium]|nr:hypothetical protein [Elusimicrobiota bacterium]
MNNRVLPAVLLVAALAPGPAGAFLENTGGSAAQFLQIGAGARSYGMGDAFCAVAEGPDAIYWNPAGLAAMQRPAFAYTRSEPVSSVHHDYAAYGHPVSLLKGTLGVSLTYQSQDYLPLVTNANLETGTFTPHAEAIAVAYATKFQVGDARTARDFYGEYWNVPGVNRPLRQGTEPWTGVVMLGVGAKIVRENIYNRDATAVLFDGGVLFRPSYLKGFSMGLAFRNVGERFRFIDAGQMAPVEFDLGAAYTLALKRSRLTASGGVGLPYFGGPDGRLGLEYALRTSGSLEGALRLGFRTRTFDDLSPLTAFTAGVGLNVHRASLDIGIRPMAELGVGYKLSLGYRF